MSKSKMTKGKVKIPNSKVQADSELERDGVVAEGLGEVVETDGIEGLGRGRLDARLKGVRRRKRARSGSDSDVLTRKMRLVKTVEERDAE
jgi:hypothetical protein